MIIYGKPTSNKIRENAEEEYYEECTTDEDDFIEYVKSCKNPEEHDKWKNLYYRNIKAE